MVEGTIERSEVGGRRWIRPTELDERKREKEKPKQEISLAAGRNS